MSKLKFKIGDKVVFKQSIHNIVYRVYSYTVYKNKLVVYSIYTDDTYHSWIYDYQLKKYKKTLIWLTTEVIW